MRTQKQPRTGLVVGVIAAVVALVFLVCGIILFFVTRGDAPKRGHVVTTVAVATEAPDGTSSAAATAAPTDAAATTITETATDADETAAPQAPDAPEALTSLLSEAGYSVDALQSLQIGQLIVVRSSGTSAQLSFFEKADGAWTSVDSLSCAGYVGSQGTVYEMSEQVSGTPKGLHPVGDAFYQYDAPSTGLTAFPITSGTYWVDDPDSKYYNQRVEGTADRDWSSAEHMADIPGYKYGFVINYNMPAQYNKGSAIFFHIGYNPTAGCVATSEDMVLAYLARLDAAANPYILVI